MSVIYCMCVLQLISYLLVCFQIKCDQYWPSRGVEAYGSIHVTALDVIELATYTIRTFQLTRVSNRRQETRVCRSDIIDEMCTCQLTGICRTPFLTGCEAEA